MPYLKTVLTYDRPSEAEVDKAFLESNGITVCLLNANTSRNELGAPFYIRLQVPDEELGTRDGVVARNESVPIRFAGESGCNCPGFSEKRGTLLSRCHSNGGDFFPDYASPGAAPL